MTATARRTTTPTSTTTSCWTTAGWPAAAAGGPRSARRAATSTSTPPGTSSCAPAGLRAPGSVYTDAGAGLGNIVTTSAVYERFMSGSALDTFGQPGAPDAVNFFSAAANFLAAPAAIDGYVTVAGSLLAKSWVLS